MAVCAAYGIPHSTFARWDADDRDKALWWHIHQGETCPQCGTRGDEWDPSKGGHDHAYVAKLHKCWGCEAKAAAEKKVTEGMGANVHAILVRNPEAR